jgi:hypothetical protein
MRDDSEWPHERENSAREAAGDHSDRQASDCGGNGGASTDEHPSGERDAPSERDGIIAKILALGFPLIHGEHVPPRETWFELEPELRGQLERMLEESDRARTWLQGQSDDELHRLLQQELERAARIERERREEAARFFNQPEAMANARSWGEAAYWSLGEAVALAFRRNPNVVMLSNVQPYAGVSPFAAKFVDLHAHVSRAAEAGTLSLVFSLLPSYAVAPVHFIDWMDNRGEAFDPHVRAAVERISGPSWQTVAQNLAARMDDITAARQADIAFLEDENLTLSNEVARLKAEITALQSAEKPLDPRERSTLYKLVLGLAMKHYEHDPHSGRKTNSAPRIRDDLALLGLSVSDDTIRKILVAAGEHAPDPEAE